jgi:hypothetical protein
MRSTAALLAAALVCLLPLPAQAAPTHPDRWVLHEAHRLGCVVERHESLPSGPRNRGVSCHVGTQRYDVLYYRQMGRAVAWWSSHVRGAWIARDGLVLVIPAGFGREAARTAADRLNCKVLPIWVAHGVS